MLRSRRCRKTYVQKQTPKLEYRQNVAEYRRIPVEYRWNTGGIPAVRSPEILPDLTLHVYTCLFLRAWGKHCRGRGERKVVVGGKLEGLQVKTILLILLSREPLVFWYSSLVPCSVAPTLPAHWPPRSSSWRPGPVALWSFCRTLLPFGSTEPWPYWRELFVCLLLTHAHQVGLKPCRTAPANSFL